MSKQTVDAETEARTRRRMDQLWKALETEAVDFLAFASFFIAGVAIDLPDEQWSGNVSEAMRIAKDKKLLAYIPQPDTIN